MNARRWERISGLLEQALQLAPASRDELYARECADDPTIAAEVEQLAAADSRAHGFLDGGVPRAPASPPVAPLAAGARVAGYTLIRRIGVGGMGVVFEAAQERPKRRVALKLVQSGYASPATLLRFRYEAEALGRLRHPGIAQVYEAGVDVDAHGDERPFLAMEYVEDARPVTEDARALGLDCEAIARLFVGVCAAVQHGHERGVLHRDIKASNVLVDATGAPKLIDFGVAKVLGEVHTRATEAGEIVGTLASMSPEQLDGGLDDVDVRSDVFALGALLYELLCGRPMLDLKGLSIGEALVRARNATPPPPSSVRPDLPIELEWIVLRAIETERERRYASAADLARDLERYLGDEPLLASPPSTVYRVRKFVLRNRLVVAAATAVLVAVVGGAIAALVQRDRALTAKTRAETAEVLAEERLALIGDEARTNRELAEFQGRILTTADPDRSGRDARVVDALAVASRDLDARVDLDRGLRLKLWHSIVDAYVALGLPREAGAELARMQPLWEAEFGAEHPARLALERQQLENGADLTPVRERWPRVADGLARAERIDPPDEREVARWRMLAASTLQELGRFDEAEVHVRAALPVLEARFGPASEFASAARLVLSTILYDTRRTDEALALRRRSYEICRAEHGEDHAQTLKAKVSLAFSIAEAGRPDEAVALTREVADAFARRNGPGSAQAVSARLQLGEMLRQARQPAEALVEVDAAIADAEQALSEHGETIHRARCRRATVLLVLDRVDEALASFDLALRGAEANLGADDPMTIDIRSQLAFHLFRLGRFEQALPHCRDAWLASCRVLGEESAQTLGRGNGYAVVLANLGRLPEAIPVVEWLLGIHERTLGPLHQDSILVLKNLTMMRHDAGQFEAAACAAELLVERAEAAEERDPLRTAGAHWALGHALQGLGDLDAAWLELTIACEHWSRCAGGGGELAIFGLIDEAGVLVKLGRDAEALSLLEGAVAQALRPGLSPSIRSRAVTEYAEALQRGGEHARARELAEMVLSGWTEIEPKIRARAERILEQG